MPVICNLYLKSIICYSQVATTWKKIACQIKRILYFFFNEKVNIDITMQALNKIFARVCVQFKCKQNHCNWLFVYDGCCLTKKSRETHSLHIVEFEIETLINIVNGIVAAHTHTHLHSRACRTIWTSANAIRYISSWRKKMCKWEFVFFISDTAF